MSITHGVEVPDRQMTRLYPKFAAYQLGLWGLPPNIVEAVAFHPWPELADVGEPFVTGALHVADYLAQRHGTDELRAWIGPRELNPECLYKLGIAEDMDNWKARAAELLDPSGAHGAVA